MANIRHVIATMNQKNQPRPYYSRPLGMNYSTVCAMKRTLGVTALQAALVQAAMKKPSNASIKPH